MAFKLFIASTAFFFLSVEGVHAAQDVLVVSLTYNKTTNETQIISTSQQTRERIYTPKAYSDSLHVTLEDINGVVSQGGYNLPPQEDFMELLGAEDTPPQYGSSPPESLISVTLPLTRSIDANKATITVKKGEQTLIQKKISEVHFEVLSGDKYTIATEYTQKKASSTEEKSTSSKIWSLPWYMFVLPLLLLTAFISLIFVLIHRKKSVGGIPVITISETEQQEPPRQ